MTQTAIPFWFMRGGTSRGPYFRRSDLPEDLETLARVLPELAQPEAEPAILSSGETNAALERASNPAVTDFQTEMHFAFYLQASLLLPESLGVIFF